MAQFERLRDNRDDGALAAYEESNASSANGASCPMQRTVQLLPLRYGLTESTDYNHAPYELESRPLGVRLARRGFVYVYDVNDDVLHEYRITEDSIEGDNEGALIYPSSHRLYVCFSDVQWTDSKKDQIRDSRNDREHFMQRINLASASPIRGGRHLLTMDQMREQVAEFVEEPQPNPPEDGPEQEGEPYHWEHQPYFHRARPGALIKAADAEEPDECLGLVLQDDIGVMLDLAQFQDNVAGWIEQWAGEDGEDSKTQRDYVLGSMIESFTALDKDQLEQKLKALNDRGARKLVEDLGELDKDTRESVWSSLVELFSLGDNSGQYPPIDSDSHPPALQEELDRIERELRSVPSNPVPREQRNAIERFYVEKALAPGGEPFASEHFATVQSLKETHNEQLQDILNGARFGARGINDLIDRERMDEFMEQQRAKLGRWNELLDRITEDRMQMLTQNRFHQAAWYFDCQDEEQIDAALTLQYACLKDIARSDDAAEQMLDWLIEHPQYDRPLFHTLELAEQKPDGRLRSEYAKLLHIGSKLLEQAGDLAQQLYQLESGRLPQSEQLSEKIQLKMAAVRDLYGPAASQAMERMMGQLYEAVDQQRMPELDELFRNNLPGFLKGRMLDAARSGELDFRLSSQDEFNRFTQDLDELIHLNGELSDMRDERDRLNDLRRNNTSEAEALIERFKQTREHQETVGRRIAESMSPVDDGEGVRLVEGNPGRAGVVVAMSAANQQQIGGYIREIWKGAASAPRLNVAGDTAAVFVAVAQTVTLHKAISHFISGEAGERHLAPIANAFLGASAAGFAAAQGLADTALTVRAAQLADNLQSTAFTTINARLGVLHVSLGIPAYLAGFLASSASLFHHGSNWLESMRRGNGEAQVGATMGIVGSGGLAGTSAHGFYHSASALLDVMQNARGSDARSAAWSRAGTRLASVFRLTSIFGLAFTAVELTGTWLYNRYNQDDFDRWLQSTPWTADPDRFTDDSLDDYQQALINITKKVAMTRAAPNAAERVIELPQLAFNDLLPSAPGLSANVSPSIMAWRIQPEQRTFFFRKIPETWIDSTQAVLWSANVEPGTAGGVRIRIHEPRHTETEHQRRTTETLIGLRLLHENDHDKREEHFFCIDFGTGYPLEPSDDPPDRPVEAQWKAMPVALLRQDSDV